MKHVNEAEIRATWSPVIESATGIKEDNKLGWMSEYCHYHKLYEDAIHLDPNMNLSGMGDVALPQGSGKGSGDKAPTLLPLAMQVAAQTIGLDLVPVVPMSGPMGLLSYLDFIYDGGASPWYVKSADAAAGNDEVVGTSRIDGKNIIKIVDDLAGAPASDRYADAEFVKAMEDHIAAFSGAADGKPYSRGAGEKSEDKVMGLSLFNKSVAAETFQVAAAVTREQVQDLKQYGIDAVAQVETVLTNELTQSINKHILGHLFDLGSANASAAGHLVGGNDNGVDTFAMNSNFSGGQNEGSEGRRLLSAILAAANIIALRGRRGAGSFAVVDGKTATVLQSVAGFQPYPMDNSIAQAAGSLFPVGSAAGVQIYTDPNMAWGDGRICVGFKGDGNAPGAVFMPYLMAESVQTIAEGTMAPKIAVKSRYALVDAGHHPSAMYYTFKVDGLAL